MKKNTQGKVLKLFITKNDLNKTRESPISINVDENGIVNDKFYGKNDQRAILITTVQSYEMASSNDIHLPQGSLGENILIDINPYHLKPGEILTIGDATLEITQNCTLCKGLTQIDNRLPKLLKHDRGIFAKVVNGIQTIKIADEVKIPSH